MLAPIKKGRSIYSRPFLIVFKKEDGLNRRRAEVLHQK